MSEQPKHLGILAVLSETNELQQTMGISWGDAVELQKRLAAERLLECEAPSNIIEVDFRGRR